MLDDNCDKQMTLIHDEEIRLCELGIWTGMLAYGTKSTIAKSNGVYDAVNDIAIVKARVRPHNLFVHPGPSGLICLDFDNKQVYEILCLYHPEIAETVRYLSGSGKPHLYFKTDKRFKGNKVRAPDIQEIKPYVKDGKLPIDIRQWGTLSIIYPSIITKRDRDGTVIVAGRYSKVDGYQFGEREPLSIPEWLEALLTPDDGSPSNAKTSPEASSISSTVAKKNIATIIAIPREFMRPLKDDDEAFDEAKKWLNCYTQDIRIGSRHDDMWLLAIQLRDNDVPYVLAVDTMDKYVDIVNCECGREPDYTPKTYKQGRDQVKNAYLQPRRPRASQPENSELLQGYARREI
jgi:hypothetical protein